MPMLCAGTGIKALQGQAGKGKTHSFFKVGQMKLALQELKGNWATVNNHTSRINRIHIHQRNTIRIVSS